jgi:hypothetical protein
MPVLLSLLRGAAIGCLAGVSLLALAMIAGAAGDVSPTVFFAGLAAGVLVGMTGSLITRLTAIGCLLVTGAAVGFGLATGFGNLELSLVAGSLIAAVWAAAGGPTPSHPERWFRWGGVLLLPLLLVLVPLILDGGTLGHDEAAYGVKARQWLEGTPGSGWSPHRGTGMSAYGYLVLALGGAEPGLRSIGLLGVLALAAGVWNLGRLMAGPAVGAMAAVAVVAGPAVLSRTTEYLSDVPSAAMLVFCAMIVWRELGARPIPSYRLLWAFPFAWAAFYLRYQSAVSLALIALVALLLWWRQVRQRPGPVIALIAIGLLGLVPHFAQSIDLTGRAWGILLNTGTGAIRAYPGEGLRDYAGMFWWGLAGYAGPIALISAMVGAVSGWRVTAARRAYVFLLVPALGQTLVLGLISHGEARFLVFPIALMMVAGAMTLDRWAGSPSTTWGRGLLWGASALVIGSLALSAVFAREWVENRKGSNEPVELAAVEVAELAGPASCGVLTSYTPQVTFYSRCASEVFPLVGGPEEGVAGLTGDARFLVLIENGKRQPSGAELLGYLALTDRTPVTVHGERRDGTVLRFSG